MAVETVAELYYQLGLDTARLDKGFIDAQKTVNQNMRLMNRQEALIKLRADVQIQGLGENIELTDALKIRQEELAQRLDLTKDRVELTSAAYEQMTQSQGENAEASQLLAIQLEKERLVMAQLERQTRELNEQQQIAIGVQWELLGLIEPALKGIKGLANAGYTFGRFSTLQVQVGTAIAMTLAAIASGTKIATDELEQENLAKLLDNEFAQAQINISNSLDTINQQALQTSKKMNQAFQYGAQREITNEDYISDFLRLESILTDESNSLSQTLKNVAGQTNYMNTELGKTIGLTVGVGKSFSALKESAKKWATPALEGFRDLQTKAQEMKIPLPVAEDILNAITLAQGNYDDVRNYVRGVQDAIIKGDATDPEALALEKYNVAVQDARGNLLPFNEALENLYQGFLKAKESGEEEAYIIMTNGQSVHDILPFLENYGKAKQRINDIKWSTSDYDSLNQLFQNMQLAEMQADEFKNALSSLVVPLANYSAEDDFNFFKTLTEIIEENRDTVLYWEFAFIETLKKAESLAGDAIDLIIEKFNELKDSETLNTIIDFIKTIASPVQMVLDVPLNFINSFSDSDSSSEILEQAQKDLDEYNAANEKARAETQKTAKEITDGLSYSWNRIRQYKDEMADIQIELKFGDNEYEKELAKLDQWRDEVLRNAKYYREEQDAIEKLYWVKRQQTVEKHLDEIERIEREKAERITEIRRRVNSNFKTDLQNQLEDIDVDKKSWIGDGMTEAEAEILAQKLKAKAITDLNSEFAASLDSIWQNSLERRFADIEREKQAWIQKGIDEIRATEFAEQQKAKAIEEAEKDLRTKEDQFNTSKNNLENLYKDRAKIYEDFKEQAQETIFQIQSIWDTELNNRLEQIEKEKQAYIQKGVDEVAAAKWAAQAKVDAERNAVMQILKSQLQAYRAFERGGYDALKRYELNQLYKQGITQKDLQMTPEQLQKFTFAQKALQNSLLPNFMTFSDFQRQQTAKAGASSMEFPFISVGMTEELKERLKQNSEQIANANEQIYNLSKEIADAKTALEQFHPNTNVDENSYVDMKVDGKPVDPKLIEEYFGKTKEQPTIPNNFNSQIETPQFDTNNIFSKLDELNPKMENVSSYFESLSTNISSVGEAFSNLVEKISKLDFPQNNTPPNITNNVSIQEAHAWDYSHIQELAEKVADVITPRILSALGGDSNSY